MTVDEPKEPEHTHRLPGWLLALLVVIALGLVAGIVLVSVENVATNRRLDALEGYVAGKGEQRDRERAQLQDSIRASICDLLDQLPQGELLDRPRAKYGCGPGIPPGQPPEAPPDPAPPATTGDAPPQADRSAEGPALPATPSSSPAPTPPAGTAAPTTAPAPPPTPQPTPAPTPLLDLVCATTGLCLEVP